MRTEQSCHEEVPGQGVLGIVFTKQTQKSSNPGRPIRAGQWLFDYRVNTPQMCVFIRLCILQLQDTLLQKEEELARLHEENNNLRQYLNSALIKCLEEKAKVWCSHPL